MRIRNLLTICITAFALMACSSDEPEIDTGGNGNGNGNGNESGNKIPKEDLQGDWIFDKYYYVIDVDDPEAYKKIEKAFADSPMTFIKAGRMNFKPGSGIDLKNAEGRIQINTENLTGNLRSFADYFTRNDTIYYYHYTLKTKYDYLLKKNNRITYNFDNTENNQYRYPDGGVRKTIYYVEYVRQE